MTTSPVAIATSGLGRLPQNGSSPSAAMTSEPVSPSSGEPTPSAGTAPHDFAAQKELHQKIRNDPDYDDWEYGTEPLPHEAWTVKQPPASA
mgnify:CR=1 FL=1